MTAASLLICWGLLGQVRATEPPAPNPYYERRQPAPANRYDDTRAGNAGSPKFGRTPVASERPANNLDTPPADERRPRSSFTVDDTNASSNGLRPLNRVNQKLRPPEIIADALSEVPEGAFLPIEGEQSRYQKLRLVDALRRTTDRNQQIRIAQAYWRLAIAQADYHFARDGVERFRRNTEGQDNNPVVRAVRSANRAMQRDAEALVIRAQMRLSTEMNLPASELIPLCIDVPLTSDYNTYFDQIRSPSNRLFTIQLTMPVRKKQIEEHGEGILTALDVVEASADEYANRATELTALVLSYERLWKERKAFTEAVLAYNQDIAEYAITVAPPNTDVTKLAGMMIPLKTPDTSSSRSPSGASRPVNEEFQYRNNPSTNYRGSHLQLPAPLDEDGSSSQTDNAVLPAAHVHQANYEPTTSRAVDFDEAHAQYALWRGLINIDDPLRTQRLSTYLHSEETLPRDGGRVVTLGECLNLCQPQARRDAVHAYWYAKEAIAVHQVLLDEANALESLFQPASRMAMDAGGQAAGVQLQAMRRSVQAAILDAQVSMIEAQAELTEICTGRVTDELLLPSSIPHGGRYQLRLEDQPRQIIEAKGLEQLGSLTKVLHAQMVDHASTVVYADTARASALGRLGGGPPALNATMAFIERQTSHTVFFLRATTKYNIAIANYVLEIIPPDAQADQIESALVLSRSRVARS